MDLSTIGVKFGWSVETTAGQKPTAFKWIPRCSKIGGLNISRKKSIPHVLKIRLSSILLVCLIPVEIGITENKRL